MKLLQKLFLTILSLLVFSLTIAQTGIAPSGQISGKVIDKNTQEPVPGANVIIQGTTIGSATDFDGNFTIKNIDPGTYNLVISYISYKPHIIEGINVNTGKTTSVNAAIEENVNNISTVMVSATRSTHTETAVLAEMKNAQVVMNGVSNQEIAKTQDRDASEVIKRVPGVTVMNNRFVMIRGLNERYNSVLLNNTAAPSFESDVKSFSFDILQSSMIDRLLIYKTAAPELPGDFAGGAIKVYTRSIPDNNHITFNYTSSVRGGTTGNEFYEYEGGKKDWLGFDDGTRNLPTGFPDALNDIKDKEQLSEIGRSLSNIWKADKISAPIDQRFSFGFARKLNFGKMPVGNYTAVNYSNTYSANKISRYDYNSYNTSTQSSDTIYNYEDYEYTHNYRWGVIHNWAFDLNKSGKIEFRNIYNQFGSSQTTNREGLNFEENSMLRSYAFRYLSRSLYSGQLSGAHELFSDKTNIDWVAGYALTTRNEPDYRRVRTSKPIDSESEENYQVYVPFTASPFFLGRFYSKLNEKIATGGINAEHKIKWNNAEDRNLLVKAGIYYEKKERSFNARNIGYAIANIMQYDWNLQNLSVEELMASQNINSTTGLKLTESTNPSDSYEAQNELIATYVAVNIPFTKNIQLHTGVRLENNRQQLQSGTYAGDTIEVDNHIISLLPSANLSYNFTEKMLVRAAYGRTLNRPEFRELAPFAFYDFSVNSVNYGNDSLLTPTIDNFDVRWEFYPSATEMFTIGGFYKEFTNPIETYFVPGAGSGGIRNYSYNNAEKGISRGVEVEARVSLKRITPLTFLHNFVVMANASVIDSKVILGDKAVGQDKERSLQGQSPYIVNSGIFYNYEKLKLQFNAMYNVIGPRIVIVGDTYYADVVELQRHTIDLNISKLFINDRVELKAGIQNLLNQPIEYRQDYNDDNKYNSDDQLLMSYKRGSYFSFSLGLRL